MLFRFLDKFLTRTSISAVKKIAGKEHKIVAKLWRKHDLISGKSLQQLSNQTTDATQQLNVHNERLSSLENNLPTIQQHAERLANIENHLPTIQQHEERLANIENNLPTVQQHEERLVNIENNLPTIQQHAERLANIENSLPAIQQHEERLINIENKVAYLESWVSFIHAEKEFKRRAEQISLFDYQTLHKPFYPPNQHNFSPFEHDNLYGLTRLLSPYYTINEQTTIEHGVYFGEFISHAALQDNTQTIITLSEYRKQALEKQLDKNVRVVGSYICYAQNLLNEFKFKQLKAELGKVLLAFPSHSIFSAHAQFNADDFIDFIKEIKEKGQFDTVLVCLYYVDIELGRDKIYQKHGFKVVTAGFNIDYHFLDRLKTLISLSDYTVSNDLGTHIGYCVQLGKPHQVYQTSVIFTAGENKEAAEIELKKRSQTQEILREQEKQEICGLFSEFNESITPEQQACVDYYFGKVPDFL